MKSARVVSLQAVREVKKAESESSYECQIHAMDKLALLEEMVKFQEERSRAGQLTLPLMLRGRVLFSALEKESETAALRSLTGAYRRHLEHELENYLQNGSLPIPEDDEE